MYNTRELLNNNVYVYMLDNLVSCRLCWTMQSPIYMFVKPLDRKLVSFRYDFRQLCENFPFTIYNAILFYL